MPRRAPSTARVFTTSSTPAITSRRSPPPRSLTLPRTKSWPRPWLPRGLGKNTKRPSQAWLSALDEEALGSGKRLPAVDTVVFKGLGKWNGRRGYAFEATATDRGEPGRGRDTFAIVVKNPNGVVVAQVNGTLDGGNIESTRLKR